MVVNSFLYLSLLKHNPVACREITVRNDKEESNLIKFKYQNEIPAYRDLSFGCILRTLDNCVVLCRRRHTFVYSAITGSKKRVARNAYAYLAPNEAEALRGRGCRDREAAPRQRSGAADETSATDGERRLTAAAATAASAGGRDIIFPGGRAKRDESVEDCLLREIQEELNIDRRHVSIYKEVFVYRNIYDKLLWRYFDSILLVAAVRLFSWEVRDNFVPNSEVSEVVFLTKKNRREHPLINRIVAYALFG
ncbi:MutT motif protein [Nile crocodilepox virus]|uniref:MutT motif protein n=1 Tax=Nile crocodilepox virus (isolate Crocodylus niloticus/Zimbabwe/Ume/2001) TaxID=1289473 RepID=Q070D4_CPRVZ|nr:MutT motif protein [Nile crocodilepox virus]ABJ09008.1 MutT motif protein [Nile crocodilepox virus]